ncbi:MAG: DUF368 domain-containing protein [Pseudomonadota bacterium]
MRQLKHFVGLLVRGFCMGSADVVPGVSGATVAFILGIYQQFIDAIRSFDVRFFADLLRFRFRAALARPHFAFLIPLVTGIFAAIIFFTKVIPLPKLIVSQPELIYALFFGLIAGSCQTLLRTIKGIGARDVAAFLGGACLGFFVVTLIPVDSPDASWFIALSGMLAICAMVVPGISGSFVLLILGKYADVLQGISDFDLAIILPFAIGAAFGLFTFSRLLSMLMRSYHRLAMLAIAGVLLASLWVIWPFQERHFEIIRGKSKMVSSTPALPDFGFDLLAPGALMIIGFVLVVALEKLGGRTAS